MEQGGEEEACQSGRSDLVAADILSGQNENVLDEDTFGYLAKVAVGGRMEGVMEVGL